MRILLALVFVAAAGCSRSVAIPTVALPFPTDTVTDRVIADGVVKRYIRSPNGPWAIHVLDVDLSRCYSAVAMKGAPGAPGRTKTSVMLEELRASREVIGGVNADFFSLNGFQGVPTGAFISQGRVIVGPGPQPVIAFASGAPFIGVLETTGLVSSARGESRGFTAWNRPGGNGLSVYDSNWGPILDTLTGGVEVVVQSGRVLSVDTSTAGSQIPRGGFVVLAGRAASADIKSWLRSFASGDAIRIIIGDLAPVAPREAVGGRPVLARDSVIAPEVDTEGQVSFRNRNPRTAVGIANRGRRLILAVIDGRQPPYSDGMTLRETAELMLALGARDAINLDGGGSSALVFLEPDQKKLVVANRPSDPTGERAVGNALAIVKGCSR